MSIALGLDPRSDRIMPQEDGGGHDDSEFA
jgi:hypothetical protein